MLTPAGSPKKCRAPMSWSALVASTAGLDHGRYKLDVLAPQFRALNGHRVVVQIFRPDAEIGENGLPSSYEKPVAAAQRAADEALLLGEVGVSVVHHSAIEPNSLVVAWLEPGQPELEFGALSAMPDHALALSTVRTHGDHGRTTFGRQPRRTPSVAAVTPVAA